jgi:adhesin HecA-like repeat protein
MKPLAVLLLFLGCSLAADRKTIIQDPAVSRAVKDRYLALTDSWVREIEFTPGEIAAMEAGKQWEAVMRQGPDDPLGKRILAVGEPSFDALTSYYPGKILDRTILGTYSDPHGPLGNYADEFTIYWNGAIACNLRKGRLTDRYGATGVQPLAHNTVVLFRVGPNGEQFGRVRSRYSSIGYELGYLPIVTAAYELDGVRYRETALADQPKNESIGWDIAYVEFEMTNLADWPRTATLRPEVILNDGGKMRTEGGLVLDANGAVLMAVSDTRREFRLQPGESASVAMKIPYIPDTKHLMSGATAADFAAAHQRVRDFWEALLANGAAIEVPEERVNNVWRALLLQNFVLADGPRFTYGSGIRYNDSTYPQENGFAAHVFAMYGFKDYANALQPWFVEMSVTPEGAGRKYQNRRAMALHHLLENYRLTGETDLFARFKADYYRVADEIVSDRHSTMKGDRSAWHWGLLTPDKPGADVQASTQTVYVLGHNITNCQGLQDFGRFLTVTGIDAGRGRKYLDEAADFRKTLLSAMERAAIRVPGRPPFLDLQTLYFAKTPDYGPDPYDDLANGRLQGAYSHYWADMEFHYNFFNPDDPPAQWIADYLHARNGFTLGLTRSHGHGGPLGYINTVYDGGYYNFRLRSGSIPEFLLGFYGRLAFAMSRHLYVASEGQPFIGYNTKDGGYVAAGLDFPNSASNADTLLMLRNALVVEELKDNIETGSIDLLRGVPRAWIESGKQIRAARMPTYFGEVSMQVTGGRDGVRATIDPPERRARLLLHVRRPFRSALVNGAPHNDCDFESGIVRLEPGTKRYTVEVRY